MAKDDNPLKPQVETVLAGAKHPVASRNLLALLFPKVEKALGAYISRSEDDEPARKRAHRISQSDFAQTYFGLVPDALSWGRQELEEILNLPPYKAMREVEQRINAIPETERASLRRQFLDALEGAFSDVRPFTAEWLRSLADCSPAYLKAGDRRRSLLYFTDNNQRLRRIILVALEPVTTEVRGQIYIEAVANASDVSILCDFFRGMVGDKNPAGAKNRNPHYFGPDTEGVRQRLVDHVKRLAASNSFWSQASPGDLLWFWWGSEEPGLSEFTRKAINDEHGFRALLVIPVHRVYSTAGDYDVINPAWSKILDLNLLEEKARSAARSSAPERELAEKFLSALSRGKNDAF